MKIGDRLHPQTLRFDSAASGSAILAAVPGDQYQSMSGTSMATPALSGTTLLLLGLGSGASSDQVSGALRHGESSDILLGKAQFRSEQEYIKLDAQEMLKEAAGGGASVLEQLERRYPVQDEMPLIFESDADRDKYFQHRVDDRAKRVEALQALEGEAGYTGPKTDWSGEKAVQISQLDPDQKAAFYANLDSLNQAYYGKVIAQFR